MVYSLLLADFKVFLTILVIPFSVGFRENPATNHIRDTLAFIVKSQRTFSTFGFLQTHKAKQKKPKELNFASAMIEKKILFLMI